LSFYVAFDEDITHNMLALMLDLKYKECIASNNTIGLKNQGCDGGIWQQGPPHSHVDEGVQAFKSKMLKCTSIKSKFASWFVV